MEHTGSWSFVVDDSWRIVYVTEATRWTSGGHVERAEFAIGCQFFGPEMLAARSAWRFGPNTAERGGPGLGAVGGWVIEAAPAGLAVGAESPSAARRMRTGRYFALGRRLVGAADRCVIEHGGLVGRHVGDGIAAFFLDEAAGSESAAARQCIASARRLRDELPEIAVASGLDAGELSLRFGLHWGATLYVGSITTPGRSDVTALGDEGNEGARIEACATDGRILASKDLVERLNGGDGEALEIDPARITYTQLHDLPGATDKARRDAPALPVC